MVENINHFFLIRLKERNFFLMTRKKFTFFLHIVGVYKPLILMLLGLRILYPIHSKFCIPYLFDISWLLLKFHRQLG